jgi:Xaa-Pro aminopeptidase
MNLPAIQSELQSIAVDGWLFLDFRRRDFFAYEILRLPAGVPSRRWAYFIPAVGEPRKLLHRIEPTNLQSLPGQPIWYSTWRELSAQLTALLGGAKRVAMQYSERNALPYLSTVDAGTIELVRSCGVEVVSSAPLVARFQGLLDAHQIGTHEKAAALVHRAKDDCFALIRDRARSGNPITEREAADFIERRFAELGVHPEGHGPNVSANANAANPHYDPPATGSAKIEDNSAVLIDLWGKLKDDPRAVVYDITWCAWLGKTPPPPDYAKRFDTVIAARDAAVSLIRSRYAEGKPVLGCEADDACRNVLERSEYAAGIWHRTGHAIDTRTHGSGVNLDNFETHDDRPILPGACFSIEPGLYLPPYGVRTEINMLIDLNGTPKSFGPQQASLLLL